jgi:hypothetical protein
MGRWQWPLREMEIGDSFTVAEEDKPIGSVENYVYNRQRALGMMFTVKKEGAMARVTRVIPGQRRSRRGQPVFKGGDGDKFLGVLQPPLFAYERWRWPFRDMEHGQWFLVDKQWRDPEKIRASAHNLARLNSLPISVNVNPPEHEGFVKIEAVAPREQPGHRDFVSYDVARSMVSRCYGVNLDDLKWPYLDKVGDSLTVKDIEALDLPGFPYQVFYAGGKLDDPYGIHFRKDAMSIEKLPDAWTVKHWVKRETRAIFE